MAVNYPQPTWNEKNRFKVTGAVFGSVLGAALAMVQITLFMMGSANYNLSTATTASTITAGSTDLMGFVVVPVLLIVGFATLGALATDFYNRTPRKSNTTSY